MKWRVDFPTVRSISDDMLTIRALEKAYDTPQGPLPVLQGVDLDVPAGESLSLMGESGSGKSTLLHLIAGLDSADAGRITLDGTDITSLDDAGRARLRRQKIGLVFQQFNLIPSLTVAANLAFQARLGGRHDPDWQEELARRLGLSDLLTRYPEQLSGGQQQRVAIGRTFAVRPDLILADEPTGNLDEESGDAVMRLALDLVERTGCAFLMVTHSARLAAMMGRQIRLSLGRLAQ